MPGALEEMSYNISFIPDSIANWLVGQNQAVGRRLRYYNDRNRDDSKTKSASGRHSMVTLARCLYVVNRKVAGSKRSDRFQMHAEGQGTQITEAVAGNRTSPRSSISKGPAPGLHLNLPVSVRKRGYTFLGRWRYTSLGVIITSLNILLWAARQHCEDDNVSERVPGRRSTLPNGTKHPTMSRASSVGAPSSSPRQILVMESLTI